MLTNCIGSCRLDADKSHTQNVSEHLKEHTMNIKRFLIILLILLYGNLNYGQLAIIKDKDGFTNVRKLPNSDAEILYKLKDSEVFSYQETESDWITVYISKNKYQLQGEEDDTFSGFIHKSRLLPIENLEVYEESEFSFQYKLKEFSFENKTCDYNGKWLMKINGCEIYGTDGNIPKIEVSGIDASINGETIDIPTTVYEDIFECTNEFVINKNKEDIIVHQENSDGAGGYLIVWVFGNKKLKQRLIFKP